MTVKVRETKERLYLFKAAGSWPSEDGVDFQLGHGDAGRQNDETEEFGSVN